MTLEEKKKSWEDEMNKVIEDIQEIILNIEDDNYNKVSRLW